MQVGFEVFEVETVSELDLAAEVSSVALAEVGLIVLQARREAALQNSVSDAWLGVQTSANTRAEYRLYLDAFGRWCAAHGSVPLRADTAQLVAFQAAREACGDSDSTTRRRWSALTSFYEFAVSSNATKINPTIGAVRPGVANGDPSPTIRLTPEAIAAYRALATALDPRLDALVSLMVLDGLKMGEAVALDVDDVRRRSPKMSVTVRRRGQSSRVDLDRDSARAVRRCVAQRPAGPLFTSGRPTARTAPRRLTRFGADHLFRRLTIDRSTDRVTANALRRFHITTAAHSADLEDVRAGAGLADLRSVRRYTLDAAEPAGAPANTAVRQRSTGGPQRSRVPVDESLTDPEQYSLLPDAIDTAADLRSQRAVALRALQVLEHALTAPAPRRHRTWLHRVTIALDGLRAALDDQLHSHQDSVDLLAELAMSEPDDARPVERLRQDLLDLTIAVASLREQIEPDPVINIDPDDIRNQLGRIANRFRQHQAVEADLVYQATGIELDEPLSWN